MKKSNVLVWGTGYIARELMERRGCRDCNIVGFVDTYKKEELFFGIPVYFPRDIVALEYDWLVIANKALREILQCCEEIGIPKEKIVALCDYEWRLSQIHKQNEDALAQEIPSLYEVIRDEKKKEENKLVVYPCGFDLIDRDRLVGNGRFADIYRVDYTRYRSFELATMEIEELEEKDWAVAELGVFRGQFAALINAKFPEKDLYLFDTFEGFDVRETEAEMAQGHCDEKFVERFKKTSLEVVMSSMPKWEQCIVRKGFFPETALGLEDIRYGFVSIDVDFEKSIYAGLEYFCPRMIDGGCIFVHDYNSPSLFGVKRAVKKYEANMGIRLRKMPLSDYCGSLAILF